MSLQDVEFLLSRASYSTTFLKNCGRGERIRSNTCPKTVVGDKQGHAPRRILSLPKASVVPVEFIGEQKTAYKDYVKSVHPQFWGYYRI